MMLTLVMNITEMMIFDNKNQFVPQHTIHGMAISSVWRFVMSTLVMSIKSWRTCSLVVGVHYLRFLRIFHTQLHGNRYPCDKEEMMFHLECWKVPFCDL
jgi:hypothetical protein